MTHTLWVLFGFQYSPEPPSAFHGGVAELATQKRGKSLAPLVAVSGAPFDASASSAFTISRWGQETLLDIKASMGLVLMVLEG